MRSPPHVRLAEWMRSAKLSQDQAASIIGVSQATVCSVLRGNRGPSVRLAVAIERATAAWPIGPIAVEEWVDASRQARR